MREQLKRDLQKHFKEAQEKKNQSSLVRQTTGLSIKEAKEGQNKQIIRSNKNIHHILRLQTPISLRHVYNFYNLLGINERAIKNQERDQSYFKTMFYVKSINKVESRKNVLIFHLKNTEKPNIPIDYIVERFKSYGNTGFYEVAQRMEKLSKKLALMDANDEDSPLKEQKSGDSLASFLQSMNNSMFMSKLGLNKLIISKSLLAFLGYDVEQFTIECLRYRAVINEIISTEKYAEVVCKSLDNLNHLTNLLENQITFDQYSDLCTFTYNQFLFTKDHKKVFCQLTLNAPNPLLNCIKVDEVLGQEQVHEQFNHQNKYKQAYEQTAEQQQIRLVRKLLPIPKNLLPQNKGKISSYRVISEMDGEQRL